MSDTKENYDSSPTLLFALQVGMTLAVIVIINVLGSGCTPDRGQQLTEQSSGIHDAESPPGPPAETEQVPTNQTGHRTIKLFLCGDVMTGRGIDQALQHPGHPQLYESYVKSADHYVTLAEQANGPIRKPIDADYLWGFALQEFERRRPDVKIINLETSITASQDYWPGKGIHYRMHPDNLSCLVDAGIDCVTLANNHVMDWGQAGLEETLATLRSAKVKFAGAGLNASQAKAPAAFDIVETGRVIVLAFGFESSGIPTRWAATDARPGVNLLRDVSTKTVTQIARQVSELKRDRTIVVASIHWGSNWGYKIPDEQTKFAHRLIDEAGVDVVYGHSSHHPRAIEIYKHKPILYGCGDFINDYEGIRGHEEYRGELSLMYFLTIDPADGRLLSFEMTPTRIQRFRIHRASVDDAQWLLNRLRRECGKFNVKVELNTDRTFKLIWSGSDGLNCFGPVDE